MVQTQDRPTQTRRPPRSSRVVGYTVAVLINTGLLIMVPNLLAWGWPAFLTPDFDQVVGLISISLIASIIFNLAYIWYDAGWFRHGGQVATGAISLVVMLRVYQVFPFDFSGWGFDPGGALKVALVVGMVGVCVAIAIEFVKMLQAGIGGTTSS